MAFRCLALWLGLIFVAGFAVFSHQDSYSYKSVYRSIMYKRVGDLCKGLSSKIPCHCKYVRPEISLRGASENDFQRVERNISHPSYIYSAYLDDRLAPDVDTNALPVVRIFTALPRKLFDHAMKNWHCLFWYEMVDLPLVMPVVNITNLNIEDTNHRRMAAMVLCSLPTNLASSPPSAVSMVSAICESPQNYLPVTDLIARRRNFERLSSNGNNTFSYVDNKVLNFTICVPPIFGDYMKTVEIIEFIELNRLLGANKFVFYLQSPRQELISCLWYYSKIGLVELNSFVLPFAHEDVLYHGQIVAQNECMYRVMYRTKYVIQQDLDEFIVPTQTTDWTTMLDLIHKNNQSADADRIASYSFRNLFFRIKLARDSTVKEPFRVKDYELKTLTKTFCLDKSNPWKQRSKVMGRPERILIWHVHMIYDSCLVRKGDVNALIGEGDGLLFHYREMGPVHQNNKTNRRMWRYQRQLFASITSRTRSYGCRI